MREGWYTFGNISFRLDDVRAIEKIKVENKWGELGNQVRLYDKKYLIYLNGLPSPIELEGDEDIEKFNKVFDR